MRFLLDQDIFAVTARFLQSLGHDVVPVRQIGLSQADDEKLLGIAQQQNRIFVTRDRDFGHLVFVRRLGSGVLYLRMLPATCNIVHEELGKVLQTYTEEELTHAFVVIKPDGHRIRRFSD